MIEDQMITMIGTDGRVRPVHSHMKEELLKKGFRVIVNAKQEYYFEYDQNNPSFFKDQNVVENIPVNDFLEVDRI